MRSYGESLNSRDRSALAKSFITPKLAKSAGLRRVDSITGAQLVGRNGNGNYGGIIFPYYWPGVSTVRAFRLRRDHPDTEQHADGSICERGKYL